MNIANIAKVALGIVAGIHFLISLSEIFLWKYLLKELGFSVTEAEKAGPIVANAGLYNAFVAAGLLWSLLSAVPSAAVALFFLAFVIVAGIFGTATLKGPIPVVLQTIPAAITTWLVWSARA